MASKNNGTLAQVFYQTEMIVQASRRTRDEFSSFICIITSCRHRRSPYDTHRVIYVTRCNLAHIPSCHDEWIALNSSLSGIFARCANYTFFHRRAFERDRVAYPPWKPRRYRSIFFFRLHSDSSDSRSTPVIIISRVGEMTRWRVLTEARFPSRGRVRHERCTDFVCNEFSRIYRVK